MTKTAAMRLLGFKSHLRLRGLDTQTDGEDFVRIVVEDVPALPDPTGEAKAKTPVFVKVHCLAEAVTNPREVVFFETSGADKRRFTVIEYEESIVDTVKWAWLCEATRKF